MRELALFAGAGGGCLAARFLGHRIVGYVEWEAYPQAVLEARIRDGHLDAAPIFGDIRSFVRDGWARRYRGRVDLVSAGFPCPAFSVAGKRHGGADERNMWPATRDVLRDVTPPPEPPGPLMQLAETLYNYRMAKRGPACLITGLRAE